MDLIDRTIQNLRKGWCKKALARSGYYQHCPANSSEAICFCLYGALQRACFDLDIQEYSRFKRQAEVILGALPPPYNGSSLNNLARFNDSCNSVEEVIEVLQKVRNVAV